MPRLPRISGQELSLDLFALPSSTPESLAAPSKATLIDKLQPLLTSIQTPKSSEILEAASTSKGKDFLPYWTDFCKEISSRLLLPIETGLQGLDSILYDIWSTLR